MGLPRPSELRQKDAGRMFRDNCLGGVCSDEGAQPSHRSPIVSRGKPPLEMDGRTRRNPNQNRTQGHRGAHQEPDEYAVVGHYWGNSLL
jgi:hypothetical protein